jgi:predicted RNase H-like HicB family nuclease
MRLDLPQSFNEDITISCQLRWEAEDGVYTIWVPSLPGCVTFGKTIEEAIEMVRDAIEIYVETLISHGEEGLPGKA